MPEIKLHQNTRNWPNSNRLFLWAISGDFSINSSGFVNTSANVDFPWGNSEGRKVSRKSVKKKRWLGGEMSFLKHNWKKSQSDLRIIVAARNDGRGDIKYSDKISVDTDGIIQETLMFLLQLSLKNTHIYYSVKHLIDAQH